MFLHARRWSKPGRIICVLLMNLVLFGIPFMSSTTHAAGSYRAYADAAAATLQGWYNSSNGQFNTTGWWNSANALGAIIDYSARTGTTAYTGDISTSYNTNASGNFLNDYYDDEGWWALGWIHSWDLTHEPRYLDMAESIFEDMRNGTDDVCGGGIWWSKERKYKNAIANELYLSVAASLANRVPTRKAQYVDLAKQSWAWFKSSGMINKQHLINDGLVINANGTCVNNGLNTWSYNQGVVLGGLVELARATGDKSYLDEATAIAKAAVALLSDSKTGILVESGGCEPNCGGDGSQFKGIFVRNLRELDGRSKVAGYAAFVRKNADSIWAGAKAPEYRLGVVWTEPYGDADASTQSSALDALVAEQALRR